MVDEDTEDDAVGDALNVADEQAVAADGMRIDALTVCVDSWMIEELTEVVELDEGVVDELRL